MDNGTFATVVGVVCAAVGSLLTLISTKGVDGWLKLRADARQDEVREEAQEDTNLRFIITRQDAEIVHLRAEMRELYLQHNDCERKYAALLVRVEMLEKKV
jgi:hypothetical protein